MPHGWCCRDGTPSITRCSHTASAVVLKMEPVLPPIKVMDQDYFEGQPSKFCSTMKMVTPGQEQIAHYNIEKSPWCYLEAGDWVEDSQYKEVVDSGSGGIDRSCFILLALYSSLLFLSLELALRHAGSTLCSSVTRQWWCGTKEKQGEQ
ncbi:uncharacterized protein LOC143273878 [Peromyscus maniculatus bairdii]|uniref:uncharacterized protein LOC143273878 n=1 Tax=Peromyscus maniculatus bairdii TaxID=230844 RepID=UPI003FCFC6FC